MRIDVTNSLSHSPCFQPSKCPLNTVLPIVSITSSLSHYIEMKPRVLLANLRMHKSYIPLKSDRSAGVGDASGRGGRALLTLAAPEHDWLPQLGGARAGYPCAWESLDVCIPKHQDLIFSLRIAIKLWQPQRSACTTVVQSSATAGLQLAASNILVMRLN